MLISLAQNWFPRAMDQSEKLQQAIDLLSSITQSAPLESGRSNNADEPGPSGSSRRGGTSRGVSGSCSRALEAVRSLRQRLGTQRSHDVATEQKSNFAPYKTSLKTGRKIQSWTIRAVCLGNKEATRVPCSIAEREILLQAGLGEKKVVIPDVACSAEEFKSILISSFPKLENCGGFELLKCRPNSKELDTISVMVTQSPAMLKSVMGSGRLFIRPIQQNLDLEPHTTPAVEITEKCIHCQEDVPVQHLRNHVQRCSYNVRVDSSDSDFEDLPVSKKPLIEISDEESSTTYECANVASVEEAMVRSAVQQSLLECTATNDQCEEDSREIEYLSSAIRILGDSVDKNITVRIEIRRSCVVKDALREARKSKFNPSGVLKVNFTFEGAVDQGGPRREFFRLLAQECKDHFFVGADTKKFFANNVTAIQSGDLFNLGRYIAMSICQGGIGIPFLAPPVYEYLCSEQCTGLSVKVADLPDPTLKFVIEKIDNAENDDEFKVIFGIDEAADMLLSTGFRKPISQLCLSDRTCVRSVLLDYHCMLKVKAEMDHFAEGLRVLGVLKMVKTYPLLFSPMFTDYEPMPLNAESLRDLLTVEYSQMGTHSYELEQQAWIHFIDFLDDCTDGKTGCTIGDVLVFFTGTNRVPPLGFEKAPTVSFLDQDAIFATASTCDVRLRLPTKYGDDLEGFKQALIMSVKDNDGFGAP